jgi:hypothetical protein
LSAKDQVCLGHVCSDLWILLNFGTDSDEPIKHGSIMNEETGIKFLEGRNLLPGNVVSDPFVKVCQEGFLLILALLSYDKLLGPFELVDHPGVNFKEFGILEALHDCLRSFLWHVHSHLVQAFKAFKFL